MPYLSNVTGNEPNEQEPDIYYRDYGSGPETIVLIHGWPFSLDMWEYQWTTLPNQGYRVIGYDRRGFGKSGKPFGGYDYTTMAADLKRLLDGLDVKNATLVGFSMGGGEVARYLGKYGSDDGRVARAAFISSVTPYMVKGNDNPEGVDPAVFQEMKQGLRTDRAKFLANWSKDFYGNGLLSHPVSDDWRHFTFMKVMEASPVATIACAEAFATTDFRDDLRKVTVPTLVIAGEDDKIVPIDSAGARMKEFVPHAQYIAYDGAPHCLVVTMHDRFNEDLKSFISGNPVQGVTAGQASGTQRAGMAR